MEVKISDLRRLGLTGNATVKLDSNYKYKIAEIHKDGVYVPYNNAIIDGKYALIKLREPFATIYCHIQTIKQGQQLVAEKRENKLVFMTAFEKIVRQDRKKEKY